VDVLTLVLAALLVESVWETSKLIWQNVKLNIDRIGGIITGILVALGAGLNIPSQIGIPINIPYVGEIMTGLLLSRGANFIHDVFGKVNEIYKRAKAKLYRG